jgi:ABC-type oligopeptide transport system ATPase subunit
MAKIGMPIADIHAGALDRVSHEFSGGQRRRIGIARVLASQPSSITCDGISV